MTLRGRFTRNSLDDSFWSDVVDWFDVVDWHDAVDWSDVVVWSEVALWSDATIICWSDAVWV